MRRLTNKDLIIKRRKKKRVYKTVKRINTQKGHSIESRPTEIDSRLTFGHWEMDTVYGSSKKGGGKSVLLVLTERKSRKEIIEHIPSRSSASVVDAIDKIERRYGELFYHIFKTITVDNGVEFADYKGIERSITGSGPRTRLYYCHPYSSCERGSNENQNKMIRRRYPKGTNFDTITEKDVKELEEWINHYPRQILGWESSETIFQQECLKAQ